MIVGPSKKMSSVPGNVWTIQSTSAEVNSRKSCSSSSHGLKGRFVVDVKRAETAESRTIGVGTTGDGEERGS